MYTAREHACTYLCIFILGTPTSPLLTHPLFLSPTSFLSLSHPLPAISSLTPTSSLSPSPPPSCYLPPHPHLLSLPLTTLGYPAPAGYPGAAPGGFPPAVPGYGAPPGGPGYGAPPGGPGYGAPPGGPGFTGQSTHCDTPYLYSS